MVNTDAGIGMFFVVVEVLLEFMLFVIDELLLEFVLFVVVEVLLVFVLFVVVEVLFVGRTTGMKASLYLVPRNDTGA